MGAGEEERVSVYLESNIKVTLEMRRCAECHRHYASEYCTGWRCGSCWHDTAERRLTEINKLQRGIAALRGALKRKGKRL